MGYASFNKSKFSYEIYLRGEDYDEMGNVRITSFSGTQVNAIVDGTKPYEVRIDFGKDQHMLRHKCTCPYHVKGKACKHIAAVLFALDREGETFIKKYPLEEESNENQLFVHASGWPKEEFLKRSTESFASLLDKDDNTFKSECSLFFKACFSIYGYGKPKENADTYTKVLLTLITNETKASIFIDQLLKTVNSNSVISIFFAKTLYNFKTKVFVNKVIRKNHDIPQSRLNSEFAAAINPMNVFATLENDNLETFASYYYFSYGAEEESFIDVCEERGNLHALNILLKRTKIGSDPSSKRILDILNRSETPVSAYYNILRSFENDSVTLEELLEAFMKLEPEDKEAVKEETFGVLPWENDCQAVFSIALGNHFTATDVQRVDMSHLLLLCDIIEQKGEEFVYRAIPKKIEKETKIALSRYSDETHFSQILQLILRFARYPLIANALREPEMEALSRHTPIMRQRYIQSLEKIGMLKSVGIYQYEEEGLCC